MAFVYDNLPGALAGLRFGDQILQINGENVAGWSTDKAMKCLKNCPADRTTMAIRDRLETHNKPWCTQSVHVVIEIYNI